ncbi:adenosylhomocysteinase [Alicyclobacillus tolerans]|uniref:adenosylhomocysteinase n=1 Tax=Alicyclobacillus tolerans TaxID=90970 RepID=UPI000934848B|nr:adenosylhomocysteinase [Alicyclobacillus montanus]
MILTTIQDAAKLSQIRDLALAPRGHEKIDWALAHMPILRQLQEEFSQTRPFAGMRIGVCLHIEAKTACLALAVQAAGAEVAIAASNPLSTQDDVVAALVERGIVAFAKRGVNEEEFARQIDQVLDFNPQALIDDGADLSSKLHLHRPEQANQIIGGCEETTTGITRLSAMARSGELRYPMMAVNDAYCKHLFDNRYGTGQSAWEGIIRATNLSVAGSTAVIVGYGFVGKGLAMRARGLGAKVIVTEVNPVRALEAVMDGFEVMPIVEAARLGDFFVTATGNVAVIDEDALAVMKDGAILTNAGHFDVEISKPALFRLSLHKKKVREHVEQYSMKDGRSLYLLAEGRLVNLICADGHPVEVMDLTFAMQFLGLEYVIRHRLEPGLHSMPVELDMRVAKMRLSAWGMKLDELTPEQSAYLNSWK